LQQFTAMTEFEGKAITICNRLLYSTSYSALTTRSFHSFSQKVSIHRIRSKIENENVANVCDSDRMSANLIYSKRFVCCNVHGTINVQTLLKITLLSLKTEEFSFAKLFVPLNLHENTNSIAQRTKTFEVKFML
jgi:hypothetical protein